MEIDDPFEMKQDVDLEKGPKIHSQPEKIDSEKLRLIGQVEKVTQVERCVA